MLPDRLRMEIELSFGVFSFREIKINNLSIACLAGF
jgi:hypothetical protein